MASGSSSGCIGRGISVGTCYAKIKPVGLFTEVLLDVDDGAIFAEGLLARRFGHRLCDCAQGALFFGNYCFGFTYIQLVD